MIRVQDRDNPAPTDEEIAATVEAAEIHEPGEEVGRMTGPEWRSFIRAGLRINMLRAVEADGRLGFARVLALARYPYGSQRRSVFMLST